MIRLQGVSALVGALCVFEKGDRPAFRACCNFGRVLSKEVAERFGRSAPFACRSIPGGLGRPCVQARRGRGPAGGEPRRTGDPALERALGDFDLAGDAADAAPQPSLEATRAPPLVGSHRISLCWRTESSGPVPASPLGFHNEPQALIQALHGFPQTAGCVSRGAKRVPIVLALVC